MHEYPEPVDDLLGLDAVLALRFPQVEERSFAMRNNNDTAAVATPPAGSPSRRARRPGNATRRHEGGCITGGHMEAVRNSEAVTGVPEDDRFKRCDFFTSYRGVVVGWIDVAEEGATDLIDQVPEHVREKLAGVIADAGTLTLRWKAHPGTEWAAGKSVRIRDGWWSIVESVEI